MSMGSNFFSMENYIIYDTPLLHVPFQAKILSYCWDGSTFTALPLTLSSEVGQDIIVSTFNLVCFLFFLFFTLNISLLPNPYSVLFKCNSIFSFSLARFKEFRTKHSTRIMQRKSVNTT